ncbi:bactofilin family protein [Hyphomonas sp. NPDC076900]|uniref:bactofilin family protein n=1 Tax=unclassified Hyphomonas TaxID=2630699 RepID=UPI003D0757F7
MAEDKGRAAPPPSPAKPSAPAGPNNVIAAGCRVIGDMTLAGEVVGDVHCQGALVVEATGKIKGRISAAEIVLAGALIGEVAAARRIEVSAGARIEGSIFAPSMRVEGNAVIDGDLLIAPERSPAHIERAKVLSVLTEAPGTMPTGTAG